MVGSVRILFWWWQLSIDSKFCVPSYGILFGYFLFFNTFPVNMVLQYAKIGAWKDYRVGEKTYIVLSLASKSFSIVVYTLLIYLFLYIYLFFIYMYIYLYFLSFGVRVCVCV